MMQLGKCIKKICNHLNESPTAICSLPLCPLMLVSSPFVFPFSDGRRRQIALQEQRGSEAISKSMDETAAEKLPSDAS